MLYSWFLLPHLPLFFFHAALSRSTFLSLSSFPSSSLVTLHPSTHTYKSRVTTSSLTSLSPSTRRRKHQHHHHTNYHYYNNPHHHHHRGYSHHPSATHKHKYRSVWGKRWGSLTWQGEAVATPTRLSVPVCEVLKKHWWWIVRNFVRRSPWGAAPPPPPHSRWIEEIKKLHLVLFIYSYHLTPDNTGIILL